ncbi:MAG: hypothetical protein OXK79_07670 [Chloroflexota bacterium]|nr:hypothetical protein [Chloroflexota bacterium]
MDTKQKYEELERRVRRLERRLESVTVDDQLYSVVGGLAEELDDRLGGLSFRVLSQSDYDALEERDGNTLYFTVAEKQQGMSDTKRAEDLLRELKESIQSGNTMTVQRLDGLYMHPVAKDNTIVMLLHTGRGGHGMAVALTYHTATTLLQALGTAIVEISEARDQMRGSADMTIPIEAYEGTPIVRVRGGKGEGLVKPRSSKKAGGGE